MNIRSTKALFNEHGVTPLKADLDKQPDAKPQLRELGNTGEAIPFYMVYGPGLEKPIVFGGNIISATEVKNNIELAIEARAQVQASETPGDDSEKVAQVAGGDSR